MRLHYRQTCKCGSELDFEVRTFGADIASFIEHWVRQHARCYNLVPVDKNERTTQEESDG